jgi:hypothetical protein
VEAFAALRIAAADAPKPRASVPGAAGFLAAHEEFDGFVGAQQKPATFVAAETAPIKAAAPVARAPNDDAEKTPIREIAADPPAIAIFAADPPKPPAGIEISFVREDSVTQEAESPSQPLAPQILADKALQPAGAAAAESDDRELVAGTLLIRSFFADAPRPGERTLPKNAGVSKPDDLAQRTANDAPPVSEIFPETNGLKLGVYNSEAAVPERVNLRNGAEVSQPLTGLTPVDAPKSENAPIAQTAPLALEIAGDLAPVSVKAPGGAETPSADFAAAPPAAEPQPLRPVPFELATITRRSDGGLEIRLDPPDLGAVSIQFFEDDAGALQASITTDRGETLDLLRRHSDFLQRELARQGAGEFTLSFSDRREGGAQAQENSARGPRAIRFGETPEAFVREFVRQAYAPAADGVDLIA